MKHRQRATNAAIIAAIIALVYLSILWPLNAGAQEVPPETPEISATWWVPTLTPFVPTETPSPEATPVIVRPYR